MTMKKFNPSINIYRKFSNKWVAFNKERTKVLASGKDILEVENQLSKDGKKAYEITFLMPNGYYFVPFVNG